jgi:hypothetical protein
MLYYLYCAGSRCLSRCGECQAGRLDGCSRAWGSTRCGSLSTTWGHIHHQAARRLRGVARRTQDVAHLQEWVDQLTAHYRIKIDRAARLRNGLIHGVAASLDAASTIRLLVKGEARVIAKSTLEAILEGKPIKQAFDGYRSRNREWKRRILTAKDITDALFDERQ